jgi:hypothetical protein
MNVYSVGDKRNWFGLAIIQINFNYKNILKINNFITNSAF